MEVKTITYNAALEIIANGNPCGAKYVVLNRDGRTTEVNLAEEMESNDQITIERYFMIGEKERRGNFLFWTESADGQGEQEVYQIEHTPFSPLRLDFAINYVDLLDILQELQEHLGDDKHFEVCPFENMGTKVDVRISNMLKDYHFYSKIKEILIPYEVFNFCLSNENYEVEAQYEIKLAGKPFYMMNPEMLADNNQELMRACQVVRDHTFPVWGRRNIELKNFS